MIRVSDEIRLLYTWNDRNGLQIEWTKIICWDVTKVQQSLYRPGQTLSISGDWGSLIHDNQDMKVVRLSALRTGRLYSPENFLIFISVRTWVDPGSIVRPEGLCQWKFPMTTSGIESAIFRLVAQCINQTRHPVSRWRYNAILKLQSKEYEI